jgi:uncharacterized membrane protein YciS (DUF1049 family)
MKIKFLLLIIFISSSLFAQNDTIRTDEIKLNSKNIQKLSKQVENLNSSLFSYNRDIQNVAKEFKDLQVNLENLNNQIGDQNSQQKFLESRIDNQKQIILDLRVSNTELHNRIDSLYQISNKNFETILESSNNFNSRLDESSKTVKTNFARVDDSISRSQLLWLFAIVGFLIIAGLIFFLLNRKLRTSKQDVITQINKASAKIEEETVRLDKKLVELLESQLRLQQENQIPSLANSNSNSNGQDHKLALKVADEIIRIQKNLSRMDENTKGLKQLAASIKRIQSNFASNGYELVEMLGKEYNEGMKVTANFIPSEELDTGEQVITRIIKPQVNYKEQMIQAAQIEVSVGE